MPSPFAGDFKFPFSGHPNPGEERFIGFSAHCEEYITKTAVGDTYDDRSVMENPFALF